LSHWQCDSEQKTFCRHREKGHDGMGAFLLLTHLPENVWKAPAIWGTSSLTLPLFRSEFGVCGETEKGGKNNVSSFPSV